MRVMVSTRVVRRFVSTCDRVRPSGWRTCAPVRRFAVGTPPPPIWRRPKEIDRRSLKAALAAERDARERGEVELVGRAHEQLGAVREAVLAEKATREEMEDALLRMLEDVVARIQAELAAERREREANEETILKLLEQACGKMAASKQEL